MATSVLSNTILTPAGAAVVGARVVARLLPFPGFRESDSSEIANQVETDTNASGVWSLPLERNADITPDNTFYEVTEYVPSGTRIHRRVWNVSIPSSNVNLLDALITPPTANPAYTVSGGGGGGGGGASTHDELTGVTSDQHHAQLHAAAHATGQVDVITPAAIGAEPAGTVATHSADTTAVHGIADTSVLATATTVATAVSDHTADTTSVHGITDTSVLATATSVATAVSDHSADTTSVHGIANTAALLSTLGNYDGPVDISATGDMTLTSAGYAALVSTGPSVTARVTDVDADAGTGNGLFWNSGSSDGHSSQGLSVATGPDSEYSLEFRGDGILKVDGVAFGVHPDLAAHDTLGLATQSELDTHDHSVTYVALPATPPTGPTQILGLSDDDPLTTDWIDPPAGGGGSDMTFARMAFR